MQPGVTSRQRALPEWARKYFLGKLFISCDMGILWIVWQDVSDSPLARDYLRLNQLVALESEILQLLQLLSILGDNARARAQADEDSLTVACSEH